MIMWLFEEAPCGQDDDKEHDFSMGGPLPNPSGDLPSPPQFGHPIYLVTDRPLFVGLWPNNVKTENDLFSCL